MQAWRRLLHVYDDPAENEKGTVGETLELASSSSANTSNSSSSSVPAAISSTSSSSPSAVALPGKVVDSCLGFASSATASSSSFPPTLTVVAASSVVPCHGQTDAQQVLQSYLRRQHQQGQQGEEQLALQKGEGGASLSMAQAEIDDLLNSSDDENT